jgi:hypothetical protein
LSRVKYRLSRCHSGELLGTQITSATPVQPSHVLPESRRRSVIQDIVPSPLGDDPCSTNRKMAKLLLHLLPCCVCSSIDINGKTLVPQVGIVRDDDERKISGELGVFRALSPAPLARVRYQGGATSYLEVLTTDSTLFSAQLSLVSSREGEAQSLVQQRVLPSGDCAMCEAVSSLAGRAGRDGLGDSRPQPFLLL